MEIFQKALVQQGVPTEDLERMIKATRVTREDRWKIARKWMQVARIMKNDSEGIDDSVDFLWSLG